MIIIDDGKTNPLIIIPEEELLDWIREKVDEAGYSDRTLNALQVSFKDLPDGKDDYFILDVPELTAMVSNIKNSRT